ncbi:hypothetical protein BOQ63_038340 [Streptomyces viridifaciens]|nr:hypothetical protein BOQ63_038340 [Streptomyces viridifaciens]
MPRPGAPANSRSGGAPASRAEGTGRTWASRAIDSRKVPRPTRYAAGAPAVAISSTAAAGAATPPMLRRSESSAPAATS